MAKTPVACWLEVNKGISCTQRPGAHIYVGSKTNWWPINDDLPQFEAGHQAAAAIKAGQESAE